MDEFLRCDLVRLLVFGREERDERDGRDGRDGRNERDERCTSTPTGRATVSITPPHVLVG